MMLKTPPQEAQLREIAQRMHPFLDDEHGPSGKWVAINESHQFDSAVQPREHAFSTDVFNIRQTRRMIEYRDFTQFPVARPKEAIFTFMGGPFEDRAELSGFPSALANMTKVSVFNMCYLGSAPVLIEEVNGGDVATHPHDLEKDNQHRLLKVDGDSNKPFDWQLMGQQIVDLYDVLRDFDTVHVICHSYGIIPFLSWLKMHKGDNLPIKNLILMEPYHHIKNLHLSMKERKDYGYDAVMEEGPFSFGLKGPIKHELHMLGVKNIHWFVAGGYRNALSKAIESQENGVFAGLTKVSLPGSNHGLNLKGVDLASWGGMKAEDVEDALMTLLREVHKALCCE